MPLSDNDLAAALHAIDVSGYVRIPSQFTAKELEPLRSASDRAIGALAEAVRAGKPMNPAEVGENFKLARCIYSWDDAALKLLECETLHAIAAPLLGVYFMHDMAATYVLPAKGPTTSAYWHRDYEDFFYGAMTPSHLWFFICLDDATPDNGATWVVPGSHRKGSFREPRYNPQRLEDMPSRQQLCAKAGDMVVINPTMLHSSGENHTDKPRRLLNVGVCHASLQPHVDHWAILPEAKRATLPDRSRRMLGQQRKPLATTWSVLPPGL